MLQKSEEMKAKEKAIEHIKGIIDAGFDHNNVHFKKAIDIAIEETEKEFLKEINDLVKNEIKNIKYSRSRNNIFVINNGEIVTEEEYKKNKMAPKEKPLKNKEDFCDYEHEFLDTKLGEHHFHEDICCKCGYNRLNKTKISEEELLKLRKKSW